MQLRGIFLSWWMNKSCTLCILDSIHTVRFAIAITNIFVLNFKLKIWHSFVIWLPIRYWQSNNKICCDGLKCNTLNVVIFEEFLVA